MNLVAVLTQPGEKQVQKFSIAPLQGIVLGRGWNSDIIIDDEYVDASHVRLSLDDQGRLWLEDLVSKNGTSVNSQGVNSSVEVDNGATIKVGNTSVKLINADTEVCPALRRSSGENHLRRFNSPTGVVFGAVIASLAMLLSLYGLSAEHASGENIASAFIGLGVTIVGWSLLGGIVGKLFRGETNITSHVVFLCVFFSTAIVINFLFDVLKFNLNSESVNGAIDLAILSLLITVFSYVTFSLSTKLSAAKKTVLTGILATMPLAYVLINPLLLEERDSWTSWVSVNHSNQPPAFLFREPTTLDNHMQTASELFAAVEKESSRSSGAEFFEDNAPKSVADNPLQISKAD